MAKKEGSVAPKERINIKYVPATGDQQAEIELPLKLVVTGDFKGHGEEQALEERQAVRIDKDSFDSVLEKAGLTLAMDVPSRLSEGDDEVTLGVKLQFKALRDFMPDAVAKQVPELNKLLELREALVALKGPLGNVPAFRAALQDLLADESARARLASELNLVLDPKKPA
jgi:type VI secretion system protein ImpB